MTTSSEPRREPLESAPEISLEAYGDHVLLIGFNRAAKRNAFTLAMLDAFCAAYGRLESDDRFRCAVVFAYGDHFTAGLDLANVAPAIAGGRALVAEGAIDPWGLHGRLRTKPVVCAIQGRCLTLGIELMLASDITIAASDAIFGQIEIKRGIFPFGGATLRMPQAAGWGNAMRWLLTGDEFSAAEAYRIGLVQEVVDRGQELPRAIELAERIAKQAPLGVRATLASARAGIQYGEAAAAKDLLPKVIELMGTEDAREGVASFVERREGVFKGR
jgi:enoyl-CoA hydratase/carnithine racemase